jgi:hypothetical protein
LATNERTRPWLAQTQEDYARLLRRADLRGGSQKAQSLLDEALENYRELGLGSHAARISALG